MKNIHYISSDTLGLDMIKNIIDGQYTLTLSSDSRNNIVYCREYLDRKMVDTKTPIYGINTGFGSLHNIKISENELETLQENLVMSHSCGMGDLVPPEIVKLMLLLKIQSLSYGKSGIQLSTIERLIYFFNNNVLPVVYEQGSLGASGDLAPLAHLSLPLLGMGEVIVNGERIKTEDYYNANNLKPITLKSKEGLALLNGTQFMSAYGVQCLLDCMKLSDLADVVGALSLDAYDGRQEAFNEIIQLVRPHKGQLLTARRINKILRGSELIKNQKTETQDPYSFRCIPQVHGAVKDTINYVMSVVVNEINAVTDNPTIFPYEDMIISGGNFHGQPLAFVLDFLAIATAELGNISERRTYHLISGKRNLPKYLITSAGVNSGFMIPQYTAASIVSQNKQYCTPASVDSIESSDGQEDYVSMGANAATKLYKVIKNVEKVLAIELFNAAQAIEFRKPLNTS
ncbi:MAG: histidine ammonia-lyase, partial [Bacteroidota bacterium]|nr:histidine ammonia-lyase [Bacteroidota bacterium]